MAGSGNKVGATGKVGCNRHNDPKTPCTNRLGPLSTSGNDVAMAACGGVFSRNICASAMRSTIRALASSAKGSCVWLSINRSKSGVQRSTSCAMAIAKARSDDSRLRVAGITA